MMMMMMLLPPLPVSCSNLESVATFLARFLAISTWRWAIRVNRGQIWLPPAQPSPVLHVESRGKRSLVGRCVLAMFLHFNRRWMRAFWRERRLRMRRVAVTMLWMWVALDRMRMWWTRAVLRLVEVVDMRRMHAECGRVRARPLAYLPRLGG